MVDKIKLSYPLMAQAEEALGIPPIEQVRHKIDVLNLERAPLKARHGPGGVFDAQRKALVSAYELEHRAAVKEGEKMTDAIASARAHADERYREFLDEAEKDKTRLYELDAEIESLQEISMRGNIMASVAKQEMKL